MGVTPESEQKQPRYNEISRLMVNEAAYLYVFYGVEGEPLKNTCALSY